MAGVALGIARRLGIAPWIVRVAFLVLLVTGGVAVFLYAAGWLLIPNEGETGSIAQDWSGNSSARRWVGVALIGLAAVVLVAETRLVRGELVIALILLGIGILLYRGDLSPKEQPSPETGPVPPAAPSHNVVEPAVGSPSSSPEGQAPAPPRDRSYLGRVTIGLALISMGVLGLLDGMVRGFEPGVRPYLALLVGIVGVGLVVGSWFGRTGSLVVLSIALVPVVSFVTFVDAVSGPVEFEFTTSGFSDDSYHRPTDVYEIPDTFRLGLGSLVVDLREVDFTGRTVDTEAEVGMGELTVYLPEDVAAEVSGRAGVGAIRTRDLRGGSVRQGIGIATDYSLEGPNGTIVLDARIGLGEIEVRRVPMAGRPVEAGSGTADWTATSYRITDAGQLRDEYRLEEGSLALDLRGLHLAQDRSVAISVDYGEILVWMPENVSHRVSAAVEQGRLAIFGRQFDGTALYADRTSVRSGEPQLVLDINVIDGTVTVEDSR